MNHRPALQLFEALGVELEYMIVAADTLDVRPITDRVMYAVAGEYVGEWEQDAISWSNELALHVIELKTTEPAHSPAGLAAAFQENVRRINELLAPQGARLMPTAMHPWMDPEREMRLWPHDYSPVYQAFDRIFDCRGHGWANLQSAHLNLPFAGDEQFGRLHAAIRLLLPILPALAASSPVVEGVTTGMLDTRLEVYRGNARKVPSVSGFVVPEPCYTRSAYEQEILQRIYADLAPHDPDGILQFEWANARGAIARFDRGTIEIRVVDVQECPAADLAIVQAEICVLQALVAEQFAPLPQQQAVDTRELHRLLLATAQAGDQVVLDSPEYLAIWGLKQPLTAGELWQYLLEATATPRKLEPATAEALQTIVDEGPLARRIVRALGTNPDRRHLHEVYGRLCDCLAQGQMFRL